MFNISLGEILLIALIALLVVGPESLPALVRSSGRLIRKMRRTANQFRNVLTADLDQNSRPRWDQAPESFDSSNSGSPRVDEPNGSTEPFVELSERRVTLTTTTERLDSTRRRSTWPFHSLGPGLSGDR